MERGKLVELLVRHFSDDARITRGQAREMAAAKRDGEHQDVLLPAPGRVVFRGVEDVGPGAVAWMADLRASELEGAESAGYSRLGLGLHVSDPLRDRSWTWSAGEARKFAMSEYMKTPAAAGRYGVVMVADAGDPHHLVVNHSGAAALPEMKAAKPKLWKGQSAADAARAEQEVVAAGALRLLGVAYAPMGKGEDLDAAIRAVLDRSGPAAAEVAGAEEMRGINEGRGSLGPLPWMSLRPLLRGWFGD